MSHDPNITNVTARAAGEAPVGVLAVQGYEIVRELARGGMGRVLEANDLAFGRRVAIKVLLPECDTVAGRQRFERESKLTGRLTHPGIPPAHRLGDLTDGSPFLAMKLVDGRTLDSLLNARPTLAHDLMRFVGVFEQVCQAVGYAHASGIVHRDLKPSNVMVGAFGEVQVMDWGLALEQNDGDATTDDDRSDAAGVRGTGLFPRPSFPTVPGSGEGTPAYMAPEQARGEPVDARADVFALGGVLAVTRPRSARPPRAGPPPCSAAASSTGSRPDSPSPTRPGTSSPSR
jgi:serine/threonine protein kinase